MIRVLLDENLPRRLKWSLDANVVAEALTVPERGWGGIKNGPLLALAASEFDVLLTMDRGIAYQQNLADVDLCMVVLHAVSNDIDDLLPLVPELNAALGQVAPGQGDSRGRITSHSSRPKARRFQPLASLVPRCYIERQPWLLAA